MPFVHLHNSSQYSLLDGAMSPGELAGEAAKQGASAVALTDSCNLYGALEFYKAAKGAGIQPVFGATIWLWPPGLKTIEDRAPDGGFQIVLLIEGGPNGRVQDGTIGYRNLSQLITTAIFDGMHYRPRIDWELLERHREGLICLTSGVLGPLGAAVRPGPDGRVDREAAKADLARLANIFDAEHLYVELQDNGIGGQPELCREARALAAELGLQTVVTNDCRYLRPQDAVTLDLLNSIARSAPFDDPERKPIPTDQQYLKTEAEMRALFPHDGPALDRTAEIAARCQFKFKTDTYYFPATTPPNPDPPPPEGVKGSKAPRADTDENWAYFYRAFPPPREFGLPDPTEAIPPRPPGAGSINGYFEWYSNEGLKLRLRLIEEARHTEYWDRLRFELDVIEDMGFPAYLLIVAEFINWAKDHEIPVGPGRGSGAGALVNFALRITDIDPLRFGLLMERFLNPERVSMPDIDVDFCQDRREEVIHHVSEKYGSPLVSQIITYGKLQAKAAIKDVARLLGLDFNFANRIASLVPDELGIKLEKAVQEPALRSLMEGDPIVGRVISLAQRVEGMVRQTGVHAAGVVISDRPIVEHAPLYRDGPDGGPVVQFDMKSAESIGLIKFDFLGLKTLDQLRDAVKMIERNTGEKIDLSLLPFDDEATFKLLQRGDGLGVFQVESSGMRELLIRLKPTTIDDLIALLALYRPGPLSSGMVDNFIECKHGRKAIEYPHESLTSILESTYGSIVYQEQVMQIAQVYSGYSLGGADLLRRAMGKKKVEEMDKQRAIFVAGAEEKGHAAQAANDLFDLLTFFAGYGFNKSHSAAYGVVSYHTAWLKAHHRAEYMAALMSIEANNTDKVLVYISDCKRAGIEVLPPDCNESQADFNVPKGTRRRIRFGLQAVKGVGQGAVEAILEARAAAGGHFKDLPDFLERLDYRRVNKKVVESLTKCGAFDWTGLARMSIFEAIPAAMSAAQGEQERKASGQTSLFGMLSKSAAAASFRVPDVGDWPTAVRLSHEREALGFFITGHPIEAYAAIVKKVTTCSIAALAGVGAEKEVNVAGMVTAARAIKTKRGNRMAFVTLEDTSGAIECIFFADPYTASQQVLASEQPILVRGKLEQGGDGATKILAESAELLSEVRERRTKAVHLVLEEAELENGQAEKLRALLGESKGSCPVRVHLQVDGRAWATLRLPDPLRVVPDEAFMQGLETLFRRNDVARLM